MQGLKAADITGIKRGINAKKNIKKFVMYNKKKNNRELYTGLTEFKMGLPNKKYLSEGLE
jgi:hypothetical protein